MGGGAGGRARGIDHSLRERERERERYDSAELVGRYKGHFTFLRGKGDDFQIGSLARQRYR